MNMILIIFGVVVCCIIAFFIAHKLFSARMQHYQFTHQLLPKLVFSDPVSVLVPLVSATGFSEHGRKLLLGLWEEAGKDFSGKHLVPADTLTYSMTVLGHPNSTAFLIELPPPAKKPEAFFALIVFDAPGLTCGTVRHLRYFTLEFHGMKSGVPKTWVGEWKQKTDGELEFVDQGEGPPPDKGEFLARVQQIIETPGSQS